MTIENIEQLKSYFQALPWYKKIFFPWKLQAKLTQSTISEAEVYSAYTRVHTSWAWPFFNWIFPDLGTFDGYQPDLNLRFSEQDENDLSPMEVALRSAYTETLIPQPNRAVCLEIRDLIDRPHVSLEQIKAWPEAIQILEKAGLITSNLQTGYLSDEQKNQLKSAVQYVEPIKAAEFIASLYTELGTLTDRNRRYIFELIVVGLPSLLKIPSYVNKKRFINIVLRNFDEFLAHRFGFLTDIATNELINTLLSIIKKLEIICGSEQILDLALEQLEQTEVELNFVLLKEALKGFLALDSLIKSDEQAGLNYFDSEIIKINVDQLNCMNLLLTGPYGKHAFAILTLSKRAVSKTVELMSKLEHLPTLTDEQKTMFFMVWYERCANMPSYSTGINYYYPVEVCLKLYSRLDCTNHPDNFQRILRHPSTIYLLSVNQILGFIETHASHTDAAQVQADFDILLSKHCLDDAIEYMTSRLTLSSVEQEALINQLRSDELYAQIVLSGKFNDLFGLPTLSKFVSKNKANYLPEAWLKVMRSIYSFSQSEFIQECKQYDLRDNFLNVFLDLIAENIEPFVASTTLMELDRLHFIDKDLLIYKRPIGSGKKLPLLYSVLNVCFEHQSLRELWATLRPNQMHFDIFRELIEDCHAILEQDAPNKMNDVRNYILNTLSVFIAKTHGELIDVFFRLPTHSSHKEAKLKLEELSKNIIQDLLKQVQDVLDQKEMMLNFNHIHLPKRVDETVLSKLISILEHQGTPLAYFTCALLLDGQIQSYVEEREEQACDDYVEKRMHDAVNFYDKAAHEQVLKPAVDYFLWHIKTVTASISVKNKLVQYDVTPCVLVTNYSLFAKRDLVAMPSVPKAIFIPKGEDEQLGSVALT